MTSISDEKEDPAGGSEASGIILRGGGSLAFGFLVRLGARLIFLFVAGRLFGATLFGAFSLAVAVIELAVTVGGVGTKRLLFQFLDERGARAPGHVVVDAALLVTLVSLTLAAGIAAIASLIPDDVLTPNTAFALAVLAPAIAGQALLDLFSAATRWRHLIRYEVVGRSIVEPYAGVAGTIAAFLLGFREEGLLIGYWSGTLAALLYVLLGARRALGGFGLARYRTRPPILIAMLHGTWANTASDFLSALYGRMDLYLVGLLLGEGAAGIYGMARQVRTPIRQVRQSFDGLLTPIVARTLTIAGPVGTGRALASAARLILAIQLPLLIVLVAVGRPLLEAIGPGFVLGYWAMICLAAAESIQGAFGLGELIFVYRGPTLGLRITVATIIVGIVSGLLFIPWWGVTGAGLSVLLSYALRAMYRRRVLARRFGVAPPLTHSAGPLAAALAGIAAAAATVWTGRPSILVDAAAAAAGVALYALILLAWLRSTGASLAMAGFVARHDPAVAGQEEPGISAA
jgi:O-antigen/teichoic acid export membrane protein